MEFIAMVSPSSGAHAIAWMVLYIGPEVFMPVLSAIAGAVGVLLMFWQRVAGLVMRVWRAIFNRQS